jgi:hypothetical protein
MQLKWALHSMQKKLLPNLEKYPELKDAFLSMLQKKRVAR